MRRLFSPALVLLLLAPVIGELVSGSAPPAEFCQPVTFITLTLLYGGGALLARELTFRWGKGWPTLLALGAAYGIAEEGLIVASFTNDNWPDLGLLAHYGDWLGINWVWAVHLTLYHAVISIGIPVLLVSLIFPARRNTPWLGRRTFWLVAVLWVLNGLFLFVMIQNMLRYMLPGEYLLSVLGVIGFIWLARRLPAPQQPASAPNLLNPYWFGQTAFAATAIVFLLSWTGPEAGRDPLFTLLLMVNAILLARWLILHKMGDGLLASPRHQLALAGGSLAFLLLLAPLSEMDKTRTDDPSGMTVVAVLMVVFLLWVRRRVRRYTTVV